MSQENFKNKMIQDAEVAKVVSEYAVEQAKYRLRTKVTEAVEKLGCNKNLGTENHSSAQQLLSANDVLKPLLKEAVQDLENESILTLLQAMSPESVNEMRIKDAEGVDLPVLSYVAKHVPEGGLSDSALCEYMLNYNTGHIRYNQLVDLTLPDSRGHTIFYYLKDKEGDEKDIATLIAYSCKTIGASQLQELGKDNDTAEIKCRQKIFDEEYARMNISDEYGATNLAAAVQDIIATKNSKKGDDGTQAHVGSGKLSDSSAEELDIAQALQGIDEGIK